MAIPLSRQGILWQANPLINIMDPKRTDGQTDKRRVGTKGNHSLNKTKKRKRSFEPCVKDIPEVTLSKETFDDQVEEFIEQVQMTYQQIQMYDLVLNDVKQVFEHVLPDMTPCLFGSSLTGIAFNTSDLDVFLNCGESGQPTYNFVKKFGNLIFKSRYFLNSVRIVSARIPIIKTRHRSTGFDLDISVNSPHALTNSKVIRYIVSLDKRIRHLLMLISYWGKLHELIGTNLFSNYSMVLLVLFYLQNTNPPLVPPINTLVYAESQLSWPTNFRTKIRYNESNNNMSLADLFKEFFSFYNSFDFSKYVISTYLGSLITVTNFSSNNLPEELNMYKLHLEQGDNKFPINCIQLQDPTELNSNVTKSVSASLLNSFQNRIEFMYNISKSEPQSRWVAYLLNFHRTYTYLNLTKPSLISPDSNIFSFYLQYDLMSKGNDLINDVSKAFTMLLFDINEISCKNAKYRKTSVSTEDIGSETSTFIVSSNYNVFTKRYSPIINSFINGELSSINVQKKLSDIALSHKMPESSFKAELYLEKTKKPGQFKVVMNNINANIRNTFGHIANKISGNLEKILKNVHVETIP